MKKHLLFTFVALLSCIDSVGAHETSAFMSTYGPLGPPKGAIEFCETHPTQCARIGDTQPVKATPERLYELHIVNRYVNEIMTWRSDLRQFGVDEKWVLPMTYFGDCEDFAILKQELLKLLGWPSGTVLLTFVRRRGEAHVVLTARTSGGDYVLDDFTNVVEIWSSALKGLELVARQSVEDPREWERLAPRIITSSIDK